MPHSIHKEVAVLVRMPNNINEAYGVNWDKLLSKMLSNENTRIVNITIIG